MCLFVLRYLHARLIRDQGYINTKAIALIPINDKILLCRIFTGDAFRQDPSGSPGLVSVLYNLSQDPYETTDLSDDNDYASILSDMLTTLRDYEKEAVDPITSVSYGTTGTGECNPALHGDVFTDYL